MSKHISNSVGLFDYALIDQKGEINGSVELRRRREKPHMFKVRITSRLNQSRLQEALDRFPFEHSIIYHKQKLFVYLVDGVEERRPLFDNSFEKAFRFMTLQPLYEINTPRVTVHLDENNTEEFENPEFQYSIEYFDVETKLDLKEESLNTNSTVDNRERRLDLNCSFCPPNRGENAKRRPAHGRSKPKSKFKRKGK